MRSIALSISALALLRLHAGLRGEIPVEDSNRDVYRELARAGLLMVGRGVRGRREACYAFADERWEFACAHEGA
jgi:hypothetical protein